MGRQGKESVGASTMVAASWVAANEGKKPVVVMERVTNMAWMGKKSTEMHGVQPHHGPAAGPMVEGVPAMGV